MNIFNCKRCGYLCNHKQYLKKHLERKNICKAILEDIPIELLLVEVRGMD